MELSGRHSELSHGREQLRALKGLSHHEEGLRRYVLAMGDQRDLVAGVFASIPQEGLGEWAGERGARLLKHQRCTRLLIEGAFSTIFDELLDDGDGHEPEDVTGALLCLAFAGAEAMVGGSRTPREQQDVERSIRIIEEASPGRLGPYARALDGAINVIVGDGTQLRGIEYLIARANEYGDVLVEALFLLLAAVGDLKAGAFRLVAQRMGLGKLHTDSHLYTSSAEVTDFPGRRFRVDEVLPFGRQLSRVMARTVPRANIAVRNFPLSPDVLRARLRIADGGDVYLFATTLADGRRVVIRCTRIG